MFQLSGFCFKLVAFVTSFPQPILEVSLSFSACPGKSATGGKVIGLALLHQETVPSMRLSPALRKLLLSNAPWAHETMLSPEHTQ